MRQPPVRELYQEILRKAELLPIEKEAIDLREDYIKAGIVTRRWAPDALHVALATVANCAIIVSWNFQHIVNFRKIPLYNGVNKANGYGEIGIFTPQEVIEDESKEV